ncbi:MAG: nucleotidyltransferase domain-containing protein [Rhizobiales bacterium]|nr:nucleotidyltransferase domain-containing protein [Hyphomicrobiales bacterium]
MTTPDLLAPPDEQSIARGIALFADIVGRRYGSSLRGLFLFGSRARGDASPFSDVDLAVVVSDDVDAARETTLLSAATYDVLVQSGAEVQPWVFRESEWEMPETAASSRLIRSAKRDARAVEVAHGLVS